MLALLGFLTIFVFLALILTKRVSVIVSLIIVPIVFALIGGFGRANGGIYVRRSKRCCSNRNHAWFCDSFLRRDE